MINIRGRCAAVTLLVLPTGAYAQEIGVAPQGGAKVVAQGGLGDASDGSDTGVGEIVVTAQRRAENLQKVPIAILVASGDALKASGITNTIQLSTISPGLSIRTGAGVFNPFIRGIGTSSNIVENPVALYIDGVYYPNQRDGLRTLSDIEQVAVLKGPQGTLFGRNATGGVIQVTTRAPSAELEGQVDAEIDNYLTVRTKAYVSGPLSDMIGFSLSGFYAKQFEGYGKNYTTGNDTNQLLKQVEFRGKLQFQPSVATKITIIGDYADRDANDVTSQPPAGATYPFPGIGPFGNRYDSYAGRDSNIRYQAWGASMTAEQDLDFAKLVSITAYRKGNGSTLNATTNDPAASFIVSTPAYRNRMISQELQLVSPSGPFNWTLGAYYFNYRNGNNPFLLNFGPLAPGPVGQVTLRATEKTESLAPFGQVNWEFLEGTTLTAGARWTYEKRSVDVTQVTQFKSGAVIVPPRLVDQTTYREPTYRIALSHAFTPTFLAYVSYNTGFKSGGYNINNINNLSYLPEKLKAYEIGFKSELLDRRVRLNAAAFHYDYTNIQVTRFSTGSQIIYNGAEAELYGVDFDLEARLTRELRLTGGLALLHAKFTHFPNANFGIRQPNGAVVFGIGDASGNRLPLSQEVTGTLALDYSREFANSSALDLNLTVNYGGDYFPEADNRLIRQPPYTMINAMVKFTLPGGNLSVMAFGRNLLDEALLAAPLTTEFGTNANYQPPRTYGVGVNLRF